MQGKLTETHIHTHTYTVLQTNKLITTTLSVVPESVSTTKHQITGWMHFTAHATSRPLSEKTQKIQNSTIGLMASWAYTKNSNFSIYLSISFHLYSSFSLAVITVFSLVHKHTRTQQCVYLALLANILICWCDTTTEISLLIIICCLWQPLFPPSSQIFTHHPY